MIAIEEKKSLCIIHPDGKILTQTLKKNEKLKTSHITQLLFLYNTTDLQNPYD